MRRFPLQLLVLHHNSKHQHTDSRYENTHDRSDMLLFVHTTAKTCRANKSKFVETKNIKRVAADNVFGESFGIKNKS